MTKQSAWISLRKGSEQQSAMNIWNGSVKSYFDRNVKVQGTKALQYISISQYLKYQDFELKQMLKKHDGMTKNFIFWYFEEQEDEQRCKAWNGE